MQARREHLSYHPFQDSEDAAAAALAIVERSMRNNQQYMQSLKSTVKEQLDSPSANLRFAGDEEDGRGDAARRSNTACHLSPGKRALSPGKQRHSTSAAQAPAHGSCADSSKPPCDVTVKGNSGDAKEVKQSSAQARREKSQVGQILDGRTARRPRPSSSAGVGSSSATARRYESVQPEAQSIRARR